MDNKFNRAMMGEALDNPEFIDDVSRRDSNGTSTAPAHAASNSQIARYEIDLTFENERGSPCGER